MRAAISKAEIESDIASRFENAFRLQKNKSVLTLGTGVTEIDELTGGLPRGAISEIFGPVSSGRTSLLFSMLAHATTHEEICALIDISDVFAPTAAAPAGADFERLLWVRCGNSLEYGFKATDLILHAGGFGLVILDIGDVAGKDARRIISSWWYRFRRTVENKPTAVVVISPEACTRSCALLTLELNGIGEWVTTKDLQKHGVQKSNVLPIRALPQSKIVAHANLLRVNSIKVNRRRPLTNDLNESQFSSSYHFR
jgi:hypothetical protein